MSIAALENAVPQGSDGKVNCSKMPLGEEENEVYWPGKYVLVCSGFGMLMFCMERRSTWPNMTNTLLNHAMTENGA